MKIHDVEQRSPEWYALRVGKPTASDFAKLITSKGEPSKQIDKYVRRLAAEKFAGKELEKYEGNAWMDRGRELEEKALSLYAFTHDVEIQRVGFITDDDETVGCSPDALINADGMTEVKCLTPENHVEAIQYFHKHGRCHTDYVQQTQGQLWIAQRRWCDLIFYHPELPGLTIRQTPDAKIIAALKQQVELAIAERDEVLALLQQHASPMQQAA